MNKQLQDALDLAWEFLEQGKYKEIVETLDLAKIADKETCYLKGVSLFYQDFFGEAVEAFKEACTYSDKDHMNGFLQYWIGNAYYTRTSSDLKIVNPILDVEQAIKHFNFSIKEKNFPSDAISKLVILSKNFHEQEKLYLIGIDKFPENVDLHISLATLYDQSNANDRKREVLNSVLNKGIRSASINFELGLIELENGNLEDAILYFSEACSLADSDQGKINTLYYLGAVSFLMGKFKEALTFFSQSIKVNPLDFNIWPAQIGYLATLCKLNKASEVKHHILSIQMDEDSFILHSIESENWFYLDSSEVHHGKQLIDTEDLILVVDSISKSDLIRNTKIRVNLFLIGLLEAKQDWSKILKYYIEIERYCEPKSYLRYKINNAYMEVLNLNESYNFAVKQIEADLQKKTFQYEDKIDIVVTLIEKLYKGKEYERINKIAIQLHQYYSVPDDVYFEAAYSCAEVRNFDLAKELYKKSISINPEASSSLNNLGVIYKNEMSLEKAIVFFKAAIKIEPEGKLYQQNLKNSLKLLSEQQHALRQEAIPKQWLVTSKDISVNRLEMLGYFDMIAKIEKVNKKYRKLLERDFKELIFNYMVKNQKSVVVLSGSLIELALTYYCEKKKFLAIETVNQGVKKRIKLYDAVLNDLITFAHDQKWFGSDFPSLGNLSRIYRNFIHPGLELKSDGDIQMKAELCYLSTIEILKKVFS